MQAIEELTTIQKSVLIASIMGNNKRSIEGGNNLFFLGFCILPKKVTL
jgi:hypothetical protein